MMAIIYWKKDLKGIILADRIKLNRCSNKIHKKYIYIYTFLSFTTTNTVSKKDSIENVSFLADVQLI